MSRRATQDDIATLHAHVGRLDAALNRAAENLRDSHEGLEALVETTWEAHSDRAVDVRKLREELRRQRETVKHLAGQLATEQHRADGHEQALRALGLSTCQVCERWLPRRQSADVLVWQGEPTCSGCVPLLLVQVTPYDVVRHHVAEWLRDHHSHSFSLIAECIAKDPDLTSWVMERSGT